MGVGGVGLGLVAGAAFGARELWAGALSLDGAAGATVPPTVLPSPATGASTATTVPDVPVGPGATRQVTYTPPTAARAFTGDLARPASSQRPIGVVLIHGGGGTGGSRADLAPWCDEYLAAGCVTLNIDYRICDPDVDAQVYPVPEQNAKAAVQYLRSHSASLGLERIVVHGASAGSRLGGIVLTTPDAAAFDGGERWLGISDVIDGLVGFYGHYDGRQFEDLAYYGGDGTAPPEAVSLERAGGASGPSLLVHGTQDSIVGASNTTAFAKALKLAGQRADVDLVPSANHGSDGYGEGALTPAGQQAASRVRSFLDGLPTSQPALTDR